MELNDSTNEKTYPTAPDVDGFYFENKDDEESNVYTKDYENGKRIKKVTFLRKDKSITVVVRQLKAKDSIHIQRRTNGNQEMFLMASVAVASTIEDKAIIMEDLAEWPISEYMTLTNMYQSLNFM